MNENELTHAIARDHVNLASGLLAMMVPQASGAGIGLKELDGRYRLTNPLLESLAGQAPGATRFTRRGPRGRDRCGQRIRR